MKKYINFLLLILFSNFIILSCAGTSEDEDEYAGLTEEEKRQQQELDEIESLLGISTDKSETKSRAKKPTQKKEEKLGLLSSEDLAAAANQPVDTKKIKKLEKENSKLKSELNQKNLLISDLKAQVQLQKDRLSSTESRSFSSGAASGYNLSVGDVSLEEYERKYQEAYDLFNAREYTTAVQVFESLLATSVNHNLSDNAQYWIGECHYALRQYDKAIMDFEKVFTFPKSNKLDDAQFKLGLCYIRIGENQKAREEFQRLLDVYPKSEYLSKAEGHLQSL
ncbi:MAG: tetratricopeptide repeat protein [Calditrichia bacterium]|nr:tetratricopeptide repeat protein [Calditrichia bacterium]